MSHYFLCEIGCEEIPTSAMQSMQKSLDESVKKELQKAKLDYKSLQIFASPRRLAVLMSGLADNQPDQVFERQGPALSEAYGADGLPTIACLGFMRSCKTTLDDLKEKKTSKGSWVCCSIKKPGEKSIDLLPEILQKVITKLPIKKPMRWGANNQSFIRPVHWVVMMFDEQIIEKELFKLTSNNITFGHRVHHPEPIKLKHAKDYVQELQKASVIACFETRKQAIAQQLESISNDSEKVIIDQNLLTEVTTLVEWPQALVGSFDNSFLDLPKEVLTTVMKNHQKCFAIEDAKSKKLVAKFCTIANLITENPALIINGNKRVMRARLADAEFFYSQDRKTKLQNRIPALAKVSFQKKLGSLADKSTRIKAIAKYLAEKTSNEEKDLLRAAELCKCDLITDMVGEFPELQGTIGDYYALADGEEKATATAIGEHYLPRHAKDSLPQTTNGALLSIADRIDTLVGMIGIGKTPTGVKDPFGLRRQALAFIKIHQQQKLSLNLYDLIEFTKQQYKVDLENKNLEIQLISLIQERLRSYYQEKNIANSIFNAVAEKNPDNLQDFEERISAMQKFIDLPEAESLSAACKRVKNILKKQDKTSPTQNIKENLFIEDAEKNLHQAINNLKQNNSSSEKLLDLANLQLPINNFFDNVMVNCEEEDLRVNRYCLLESLYKKLTQVADITLIHDK